MMGGMYEGRKWRRLGDLSTQCVHLVPFRGPCENCDSEQRLLREAASQRNDLQNQLDSLSGRALTDDELRAECERRGIPVNAEGMKNALRELTRGVHADRDSALADLRWHKEQFARVRQMALDGGMALNDDSVEWLERRVAERDEWKRRAEHMAKRIDEIKAERNAAEESLRHWIPKMRESGPGIDPRPDNSVSHLLEDLLADDE